MTTAKSASSRRARTKASTSQSSTRRVETRSISSLLGELDDVPDGDIRSVTLDELKAMYERGETVPTSPDAPEIELDDEFWENAVLIMPGEPLPGTTASVELPIDALVLAWFKRQGEDYLARMSKVLRDHYLANRKKAS